MNTLRLVSAALLLALGLSLHSSAKVLDPGTASHPVLTPLADTLDKAGIDVIVGRSVDFEPSARPRLAQLHGFAGQRKWDWGKYWRDVWINGFEKGLIGALIAMPKDVPPPAVDREVDRCAAVAAPPNDPTCEFLRAWLSASPDKRVFVAFTRSDLQTALSVQAALGEKGYATFVYLREGEKDPWAHPDFVGAVFAQAHHRLVIDSLSSRGSEGVAFEASCVDALTPARKPKDMRWMDFIAPPPPKPTAG